MIVCAIILVCIKEITGVYIPLLMLVDSLIYRLMSRILQINESKDVVICLAYARQIAPEFHEYIMKYKM